MRYSTVIVVLSQEDTIPGVDTAEVDMLHPLLAAMAACTLLLLEDPSYAPQFLSFSSGNANRYLHP